MTTRTLAVRPHDLEPDALAPFRFGQVAGGTIVTNEYGEWHHFPTDQAFHAFLAGDLEALGDHREQLTVKGFLRDTLDLEHYAGCMRRRKRFVGLGPAVHHIPLAVGDRSLSVDIAKEIIDFAMLSTSGALDLRLACPGAPDLDLLGFLAQYGTEKNRYEGKAVTWRLLAEPAHIDDAAAAWLVDKRFMVRATWCGAPSDDTIAGIARLIEASTAKKRREPPIDVEILVHAGIAGAMAAIAAQAHAAGIQRVRLTPVLSGPDRLDTSTWRTAYAAFLAAAIEHGMVEERTGTMTAVATSTDGSEDVTVRSPSGIGSGMVAYDLDGQIFPSPEAMGLDDADVFVLGKVGETSYKDATTHPTLRALTVASLLECLPGFADHWATPFLGVDPIATYARDGDLFDRAPTSATMRAHLVVLETVFTHLVADDDTASTLRGWAR